MVLKRLRGRDFDAVHSTHIVFLPMAVFLGWRRKAGVVYDAYEFYLQDTADRLPFFLRWTVPVMRKMEAALVRRADGVLTIDSYENHLAKYYDQFNSNTSVLYNVPDLEYSPDHQQIEKLRRHYQDRRVVIYVGGISNFKGGLKALESLKLVAAEVPDVLFLFIGLFHAQTESAFWESVCENHLEDNVEFISWLPYQEMLQYVAISEVGMVLHQFAPLMNLLGQGNGRKIFTYMQVGIPIVAPEQGEVGRIVQQEDCGLLVDVTDARNIADAIIRLLNDSSYSKALGERGRRAVEEKFNWEIEKQKLFQVYNNLECNIHGRKVKS